MEYGKETYAVTVDVADNDGKLKAESIVSSGKDSACEITFNNIYKPEVTGVVIGTSKILRGRRLKDGELEFVFTHKDGNVRVVKNNGKGEFKFDMSFDEPGEYVYHAAEKAGNEEGMTYDDSKYTVTVKVTDSLKGFLQARVKVGKDGREAKAQAL